MDLAARSARLTASAELMSGRGAPARTATPTPDRTRSTRLPAATLPCAISWSIWGPDMITRPQVSPAAIRFMMSTPPTKRGTTLWPLACSKPGKSSSNASRMAFELMTWISTGMLLTLARRLLGHGVMDDLATDHGDERLDVLDLVGGHREIVAVQDEQVGILAGRERAEIAFLEHDERVRARVRDQRLFTRNGLPVDLAAADHLAGDGEAQGVERVRRRHRGGVGAEAPVDA